MADGHVIGIADNVDTGVFQAAGSTQDESDDSTVVASTEPHHLIPDGVDDAAQGSDSDSGLGSGGSSSNDTTGTAPNGTGPFIVHTETETAGVHGQNDRQNVAENIAGLSTSPGATPYAMIVGQLADETDWDYYTFEAHAGDVIGLNLVGGTGSSGTEQFPNGLISLLSPQDVELVAGQFDINGVPGAQGEGSYLLPDESPLPRGGDSSASYVIPADGTYSIVVSNGVGNYSVDAWMFRPGLEYQEPGAMQTVFLDFDGAILDTTIFGAAINRPGTPGTTAVLSPFFAFLDSWNVPADNIFIDIDLLFESIIDIVRQQMISDLFVFGNNPNFALNLVQNLDPTLPGYLLEDPFGETNVSRVIVGGTIAESGVDTIGIAESVDPGNFATEESALVLMDILSGDLINDIEIYEDDLDDLEEAELAAELSRRKTLLVATAVATIVSHEAGHYLGSFHTDGFDGVGGVNIMDEGPGGIENILGLGDDEVWFSPDDVRVTFGVDFYSQLEGIFGQEDTLNTTAFGLSTGQGLGTWPPLPIGSNNPAGLGGSA